MNHTLKDGVIEMEQKPEKDHDFSFLEVPNQKTRKCYEKNL